jgi:hypothetical protein
VVGIAVAMIFFFTYAWALEGVGGHHLPAGPRAAGQGRKEGHA